MNARKYFSIGSDPTNELQLAGVGIQPFHLFLHKDAAGQVFASSRAPGALFSINNQAHTELYCLQAQDSLTLAGHLIDWKAIFEISQEEIQEVEQTKTQAFEADKRLKMQLILIYTAVAALLILMVFYI